MSEPEIMAGGFSNQMLKWSEFCPDKFLFFSIYKLIKGSKLNTESYRISK